MRAFNVVTVSSSYPNFDAFRISAVGREKHARCPFAPNLAVFIGPPRI